MITEIGVPTVLGLNHTLLKVVGRPANLGLDTPITQRIPIIRALIVEDIRAQSN